MFILYPISINRQLVREELLPITGPSVSGVVGMNSLRDADIALFSGNPLVQKDSLTSQLYQR